MLQEGLSIIRSTEAGARTGMIEMMWGENQIQTLIQETAKGPNITGMQLLDKNGKVVASSNLAQVGFLRSNFRAPKNRNTVISKIVENDIGMEVFQIVKQFEPIENNPNITKSMSGMMGNMMGSSNNNSSIQKPQYIVLNLSMEEYKNAQADDIRRAVISAIILLVIGSASF